MKDIIRIITNIINSFHDFLMQIASNSGFKITDKDLHLWVFGIIGISSFFIVHFVFKSLVKYSVTAVSFIYTFTVMIVLVFAVEIEQKITGRGQMEFDDAVISLWGFLLFFAFFLMIKGVFLLAKRLFGKKDN